ncbi:MAG: AMP-binding protein [Actinobacteria bacterium]|nr:AMP-binding protein [Actinomycetota bacterium]
MDVGAERPWLGRYGAGVPADLGTLPPDVLTAFRGLVAGDSTRDCLRYGDAVLAFGDVDRFSDALAVGLAASGVGPGDRVAVMLQNVPTFPIVTLASWKLGASVVPVNPMYRVAELSHILDDSGACVLITSPDLLVPIVAEAVRDRAIAVVVTDPRDLADGELPVTLRDADAADVPDVPRLLALIEQHDGRRPEPRTPAREDAALLSYTSGTTGPPKGAINSHGNVAASVAIYVAWMDIGPDDVCLGVAPLFHITGSVAHVAISLATGMPLVLAHRFDAAETLALVARHGCTFTVASITVFIALMNVDGVAGADLRGFRKLYSGGAPIAPATVEAFEARFGTYIHSIYGMTETTSPSHAVPLGTRAPVDPGTGALSVGVPVPGTVCRIVGDDGRVLPAGQLGELVTAGPQVVAGYWGEPEGTARAIGPDGIRTGDVGFMDEAGWFFLVDRKKDVIIASGYKVWPREVEDVLYQHPAVREAAVVGVADAYRGETVAAFVSLRAGADATPGELVAFCRERLAAYKAPRSVELRDELPKTASGKILRRSLG